MGKCGSIDLAASTIWAVHIPFDTGVRADTNSQVDAAIHSPRSSKARQETATRGAPCASKIIQRRTGQQGVSLPVYTDTRHQEDQANQVHSENTEQGARR